jgi:hypothetical protein
MGKIKITLPALRRRLKFENYFSRNNKSFLSNSYDLQPKAYLKITF